MGEDFYGSLTLRPTRIGFLVKPNDLASVKRIMSLNAALWGGMLNPIIPVFQTAPAAWRERQRVWSVSGYGIAKGYVRFFEPDVYVESDEGLAEKIGIAGLRATSLHSQITTLASFVGDGQKAISGPQFGLSAFDCIEDIFQKEARFQLKRESKATLCESESHSGLVEALVGAYPSDDPLRYISEAYVDAFSPTCTPLTPDLYREIIEDDLLTPLRATQRGLSFEPSSSDQILSPPRPQTISLLQ